MRNPTAPADDLTKPPPAGAFRQPVVWLGAAILVATIAGCIATIVISLRYADTPVESPRSAFKVPLPHPAPPEAK
ncbi:MAG: hypothetical protein IT518_04610 [Burkholderiales bacterium]|nr:hypothetical protein [Burkholderiales bacterium]